MSPGNPRVRLVGTEVLSDAWYVLRRTTFDLQRRDGSWSRAITLMSDQKRGAATAMIARQRITASTLEATSSASAA